MNGLRCPKCELVNLLTAESCHRCGASLLDLPSTAQVSVPVDEMFQAQAFKPHLPPMIDPDNETGRKTFFWYRIYLSVVLLFSVFLAVMGIFLVVTSQSMPGPDSAQAALIGAIYGFFGGAFALVYAVALFLPRKPYNWIVGIVLIALGLTSCCSLPAAIPLLIFWLKAETKAFFGRN